jgi:hypothetical protein
MNCRQPWLAGCIARYSVRVWCQDKLMQHICLSAHLIRHCVNIRCFVACLLSDMNLTRWLSPFVYLFIQQYSRPFSSSKLNPVCAYRRLCNEYNSTYLHWSFATLKTLTTMEPKFKLRQSIIRVSFPALHITLYFSPWRKQPLVGQGLLIVEVSRSHAPQPVGLLWTSDQPVADTSTLQHTTLTTDIHAPGWIRTHNPSKRTDAHPRLGPRGHCDRKVYLYSSLLRDVFSIWDCLPYISDGE